MSDVPLTSRKLQCLICNFHTNSPAALQWHGMSSHGQVGRVRRHRRKQLIGAEDGEGANGGASAGAAGTSAAPLATAVGATAATSSAASPTPLVIEEASATTLSVGDVMRAQAEAVHAEMDKLMSEPLEELEPTYKEVTEQGQAADDGNGAVASDDGNGEAKAPTDAGARTQELIAQLDALLACSKEATEGPAPKRRKDKNGAAAEASRPYDYSHLAEHIRTLYEEIKDWQRAEPILSARKRANPGKFDTFRLQALQRFALRTGRAGLSLREQEDLFDLLDVWDGTRPGMPIDLGHKRKIRDSFRSAYAFQCAMRDDLDAAVLGAGWKTCVLEEGGEKYVAIFRSAMDALLEDLRSGKKVRFWSGGDKPAPPTHMRETPMDGDAFRLAEEEVVKEHSTKPGAFMMGIHVYSDSSLLSWSGGMFGSRSSPWETVGPHVGGSRSLVRGLIWRKALLVAVAVAVVCVAAMLPFL